MALLPENVAKLVVDISQIFADTHHVLSHRQLEDALSGGRHLRRHAIELAVRAVLIHKTTTSGRGGVRYQYEGTAVCNLWYAAVTGTKATAADVARALESVEAERQILAIDELLANLPAKRVQLHKHVDVRSSLQVLLDDMGPHEFTVDDVTYTVRRTHSPDHKHDYWSIYDETGTVVTAPLVGTLVDAVATMHGTALEAILREAAVAVGEMEPEPLAPLLGVPGPMAWMTDPDALVARAAEAAIGDDEEFNDELTELLDEEDGDSDGDDVVH